MRRNCTASNILTYVAALWMSVSQVALHTTVLLGAIAIDRVLTKFVIQEGLCGCYCYCYLMSRVLTARSRTGRRRFGRRLLLLPSL
jgi:hypothetical protein